MFAWFARVLLGVGVTVCAAAGGACDYSPRVASGVYAVTSSVDSLEVDDVCTFREAWIAATTFAPIDTCPAGVAGQQNVIDLPSTWLMALAGSDNASATGDLDSHMGSVLLRAAPGGSVLDAASVDRLLHLQGTASLEIGAGVTLRAGCANGGTCSAAATGSIPSGGAIYDNSLGSLKIVPGVRIEDSIALAGGALAICADPPLGVATGAVELEGVEMFGNSAASGSGGAVDAHVDWSCHGCTFVGNAARWGGAISQYAATARILNSEVRDNNAVVAGGGLLARGQSGGASAGAVEMTGGTLGGNDAGGPGGAVWAGGRWPSEPCSAAGCRVTLVSVVVEGNRADVEGGPSGSGGGVASGGVGVTPGLLELRGATQLSANIDLSEPLAPDCSGEVHVYDTSTVANAQGCTVVDHRQPPAVCGNGVIEAPEQCDEGGGCCAACAWAPAGAACSDGDECTPADVCSGSGECLPGGTVCGDGVVQLQCGERVIEGCRP